MSGSLYLINSIGKNENKPLNRYLKLFYLRHMYLCKLRITNSVGTALQSRDWFVHSRRFQLTAKLLRCCGSMDHFTRIGVKQTKPWPIIGDLWRTIFRQMSVLESIQFFYNMFPGSRYSGMYQFSIPTLVIKDPELLKQLTVRDFDHFTDHRILVDADADPLWSGNLFALTGRKWKDMRATLSGSFSSSKIKRMFHVMNGAAENFVIFFLNKNETLIEVEMRDTFSRFANDIIATTAFGIEVDSLKSPNNPFHIMGKRITDYSSLIKRLRFFAFLIAPRVAKLLKIGLFEKDISSFFYKTIKETIQVREEKGIVREDMLNILLEARKGTQHEYSAAIETGFATVKEYTHSGKGSQFANLTDDDIAAQAMVFYVAGFETISNALCFGSYELAVNKEIQNKLRSEIVETHRLNGGKVTYDSLLKMKYMDMVISEILRKWPPAGVVDRVATKPYTIEPVNADEKPVHLKIGDLFWIPMFGFHRDPKNFENPTKFDPERFSDENKGNIKPYTYVPFGAGPRNCIASRFALLELKTLFYHLLLNFEIEPTKVTTVPLKLCKKSFRPSPVGGFWLGLKRLTCT
uniref:Cytochrome P450 n=1 Tax=Dendroctonus ponderosae TaxID=77166 RepID=A0AAR5PXI1_DENPD